MLEETESVATDSPPSSFLHILLYIPLNKSYRNISKVAC